MSAEILLSPKKGSVKKRVRRARGNASGLGGEAGRGHKGQKSRTGYSARSGFEGGQTPLYRRLPKKRGYGNPGKHDTVAVNLDQLDRHFSDGDVVDYMTLLQKKLIKKAKFLKVLGNGSLSKKLTIRVHTFSKSVPEKLQESGSSLEIIT